jgi:hypothetical protein
MRSRQDREQPKFKPGEVFRALVKARGLATEAARILQCSPQTIYRTFKRYPQMRVDVEDVVRPAQLDKAKKNILDAVDEGDCRWSAWLLERWDKANFSTRQEHTGADGGQIEHKVTVDGGYTDEFLDSLDDA